MGDSSGDEMNLHMPQDVEAEVELRLLAAIPHQIISPANNSSIIGIFQDSLLGAFLFTQEHLHFTPQEAMNLLMMFPKVNETALHHLFNVNTKKTNSYATISNFEILSQILPPLSLKYKKNGATDWNTPNEVVEIKNGVYKRGQMNKAVLGAKNRGLIQRICNDFGNEAATDFIDNLQNIVTLYMKTAGFSVGISDLFVNAGTKSKITDIIVQKKQQAFELIQQTQLGIFKNNTGQPNQIEFEQNVCNILNDASNEAGKVGLKNLKDNRFAIMESAGSKGSLLNMAFMISCLGQQNMDNKRIPYNFEHRTLPHYLKYDDTPVARGFVENSYVNGLTPQEAFFHAMAGRIGLIDTAVKTASTGYIQRRLIKGLEDLKVEYDMTVRNNKNKIVQFAYGEDNIDVIKVETQTLPLLSMNVQEIYAHYLFLEEELKIYEKIFVKSSATSTLTLNLDPVFMEKTKQTVQFMIQTQADIIAKVFNYKKDIAVQCPVAFSHIIENIANQCHLEPTSMVDIDLLTALKMIEDAFYLLTKSTYAAPTLLFKTLYFYHLCPKQLICVKRFNKTALALLLDSIVFYYKKALINPGEMVGIIAGQSIGEVSTQMTLNTFHFAGVASKSNVTRGVPRIDEILLLSPEIKNPSLTIYLKPEEETIREKAQDIMYMIEHTKLEEIVQSSMVCFDPLDNLDSFTLVEEDASLIQQYREFESMFQECTVNNEPVENRQSSHWIIRMVMDHESMLERNITMDDVFLALKICYAETIDCIYSDFNSDKLIFRIRVKTLLKKTKTQLNKILGDQHPLDESDQIYILRQFQETILKNVVLRGTKNIKKVNLRTIKNHIVETNGSFAEKDIWVLDTVGTNLMDILCLDFIDTTRTISNDIIEIYNVLGIEAARLAIFNELVEVVEFDDTYINYHNYSVLVDRMTFTHKLISFFRHGINNDNTGPIAKASFEETPEMFLKAARYAELDPMRGVSANVMCGQEGYYGTACFNVLLNVEEMRTLSMNSEYVPVDNDKVIQEFFVNNEIPHSHCSIEQLTMKNNVGSIVGEETANASFYATTNYDPGF